MSVLTAADFKQIGIGEMWDEYQCLRCKAVFVLQADSWDGTEPEDRHLCKTELPAQCGGKQVSKEGP